MKAKEQLPPYVMDARRAIKRALPNLSEVQVLRLAATAELLAFGEDRGRWASSADWSEQKQQAQPYQVGNMKKKKGGQ